MIPPNSLKTIHLATLTLAALLLSGMVACQYIGSTPIGKINADPREYVGKTLSVSGEVSEVFSLFIVKYFVLKDESGSIAVVTDRPLPKVGQKLKVTGTVQEAFSLGDQQMLVLIETPRQKHQNQSN